MKIILVLFLSLLTQLSIGQNPNEYAAVDKKMLSIPESLTTTTKGISDYINSNFTTENQKIRAVYFWTANNISYDVPNMFEPNGVETSDEKIAKALTKRKGVCIHYAEVFNSVANQSGIKTYIIPGYTKQFGKVAPISHAWCISKVDGKWFVFDPTWGAGYLEGKKYVKKMNNTFFKAEPAKMINSHMPFDYLWQLLNTPVTNQEFISGKPDAAKPKMNFDFATEIENYDKLSDSEKAFQASQRIEKNGLLNNLILDFYDSKKKEFTILNQNKSVDKLNAVSDLLNETISYLNDFILFRNRKFKPKQSDETLKKMMQDIKDKMKQCQEDVYKVGQVSSENATMYNQLKRHILETSDKVKEQENFLNEYLSKGSLGRKLMFTNLR